MDFASLHRCPSSGARIVFRIQNHMQVREQSRAAIMFGTIRYSHAHVCQPEQDRTSMPHHHDHDTALVSVYRVHSTDYRRLNRASHDLRRRGPPRQSAPDPGTQSLNLLDQMHFRPTFHRAPSDPRSLIPLRANVHFSSALRSDLSSL